MTRWPAPARARSLPGRSPPASALVFLVVQACSALVILFQFNRFTVWAGVASLVLVAIYPFMKRITWWPQAFLGLAFSWGALVGWSARPAACLPPLLLYLGTILWVIGYDTIYALQDVEDDALIGVKSTAPPVRQRRPVRSSPAFMPAPSCSGWRRRPLAGAGIVFAAAVAGGGGIGLAGADPRRCCARQSTLALRQEHVGIVLALAFLAEWVW